MNREKRPQHFLATDPDGVRIETKLGKAPLRPSDYEKLLSWWTENGCLYWLPGRETAPKEWRKSFARRIPAYEERFKWKEIMGGGRDGAAEDVREWQTQADGDPLMFLNLAGVPPLWILRELEFWKIQKDRLDSLRKRLRSKDDWEKDVEDFRRVATLLDSYKPLFDSYSSLTQQPVLTSKEIPKSSSVKVAAEIIQEAHRLGLIPPGAAKKGGPPKVEFPVLVRSLVWLTIHKGQMPKEWEQDLTKLSKSQKKRMLEESGERSISAHWRAITVLLMAAFPQWFKRDVNPIRNVKNAFKSLPNREAHWWWSLALVGKPKKGTHYAPVEWR